MSTLHNPDSDQETHGSPEDIADIEYGMDRFVHPDETRTDEQIDFDERHAVEPWDDNDEEDINPEDFKKPTTNVLLANLEAEIKARSLAEGIDGDIGKVDGARFVIKDQDGNPSDTLEVSVSHYEGMYSRPGVQGFYLAPINGEKDQWDRDREFVHGSFWGSLQPATPEESSFSMSYGGGPTDEIRQYAVDALQADVLANAELVELKTTDKQPK